MNARDPFIELERANAALWSLDPGCARPEWVKLAMAFKAAGGRFDDFHAWSAQAGNYLNERDVRSMWNSLNGEGVGPGSLFEASRAAGWQDGSSTRPEARQWQQERARTQQEAPQAKRQGKSLLHDPNALWSVYAPATSLHPYLVRKAIAAHGCRVAAPGLRMAGHDLAGWLAVPVWGLEAGSLQSIQFVSPESGPPKLSLKDCPIAGGVFVVHEAAPEGRPSPEAFAGGVVYLAEGFATCASIYQATGRPAVATFGKGNMETIAKLLRQQFPTVRLVLCPDRGAEAQAEKIARAMNCSWVALPESYASNSDLNDYAQAEGMEAVEALLQHEHRPPLRYRLRTADELAALPPIRWRIRGILPESGIAAVFGPSGSGKSFLVLDMLAAITEGRDWFGARTKPCPVVYLALEGEAGIAQRVQALRAHHGETLDGFHFLTQPLSLLEQGDLADLVQAICMADAGNGVAVVDTLNRAAPGADENSSVDMGRLIEAAKRLQAALGGLVLLVHHSGKDQSRGLRGHSSLLGAIDASIEVTRNDDRRAWRVGKAKDGRDGEEQPFRLEVVELGTDAEGETVTSCVVVPDTTAGDVKKAKLPQGGNQKLVLDALRPLLRDSADFGKAGAPSCRPCIELEAAVPAGASVLTCPTDKRTSRARDAITGMVARGVLGCKEGWIWLI